MTAKEAYQDLLTELFKHDNNPTYELASITLDNRYGIHTVLDMERAGYIKYVGKNHNNIAIYQVR